MIEPSVSVPMAAAHRLAATATPEPELEPHGLRSSAYGLRVWPPRLVQPLTEWMERKLAHSLRLVLPRITAPASRSLRATVASCAGDRWPSSAREPAVVSILSAVSMLSLIRTGMPWSGPRGPRSLRSASRASAMASAWGLISMTALSGGQPGRSHRCGEIHSVIDRAVCAPACMPAWSSGMVSSVIRGLPSLGAVGRGAIRPIS